MPSLLSRFGRLAAISVCCGIGLAGCGQKSHNAAGGSQVVAHVGEEAITTQELDNEFRLANISSDKQKDPEIVKRVLSELVTRKYLLQKALEAKLDREPGVLLDILRSREQVLESALLQRNVASKGTTRADVEKYIANNASKFADRKIWSVEQLAFLLTPTSQSLVEENKDAKSLDEVDQQLSAAGTVHSRQMGTLSSSEVPQDFYNTIEAKKTDNVFFVRSGPNGVFFQVKGEQSRPLEGEAAANLARQLMRADAIKAEIGIASYSANIEAKYENDYYANIMRRGEDKKN